MKIVVIEACNFIDYPTGGQLTFARQFIKAFKNRAILIGITTNPKVKLGKWSKIKIDDNIYDFLPILYRKKETSKPIIPGRIQWILALFSNLNNIKKIDSEFYYTQDIASLYPINKIKHSKVLHNSAGLNNPFINPRYKWSKFLRKPFEKFWHKELSKTYLLMAAADQNTINSLKQNSNTLRNITIHSFPTRFDDNIFFPKSKFVVRKKLNIPNDIKVIITSGRINKGKGWDLVIETCKILQDNCPKYKIYWLGDGEDRNKLEDAIKLNNLRNLFIVGNVSQEVLSDYLSAADLFILGSYREGWSTSIVEALACGKNVVSTNVSSAKEMIKNNKNGFVVENRNPDNFAKKIIEALILPDPNQISVENVDTLKLSKLKNEFLELWQN